jgi:hypothetical protein
METTNIPTAQGIDLGCRSRSISGALSLTDVRNAFSGPGLWRRTPLDMFVQFPKILGDTLPGIGGASSGAVALP